MFKHEEAKKDQDIIAFLGKGTEFKGVITYHGTIRIDGSVEGEIITEGTLIIGETAVLQAEVTAGTVISAGKITGNITAHEKIQLLPPAALDGSIKTPLLIIEEGVRFNGHCEMSRAAGIEPALVGTTEEGRRGS
jgi:cytoskeletal protein CcmA (bactofilin family)